MPVSTIEFAGSAPSPAQLSLPAVTAPEHFRAKTRAKFPRLLIPSFSDCFFLAVLVWLFVAGATGWKALLMDGDTGWHIRTGQYILDHGSIPHQDLFSYSKPGAAWFAWEWLSDVVFALLFGAAGLKGIVLFAGVLIAGLSTILLRYTLWLRTNSLIALLTTLLAVGSSSMHFLARPHLFTLLLLPICLWLLQRDRGTPTLWVWMLVPVVALWANLHGGFMVFLACLALLVLGGAVESRLRGPGWTVSGRYLALFAACSSVTVLNPYGVHLHEHIWQYLRSDWIRNLVQEFQAPTFRSEGQLQFEVLLILGLLAAGVLLIRGKITELLWLLFLAHSSLTSVRHAPLYALVAAPLLAVALSDWWKQNAMLAGSRSCRRILFQLGQDLRPGFMRTSLWVCTPVLALSLLSAPVPWPRDFPSEAFPTDLIQRNQRLLSGGRVFTSDQWADYFIYLFYPKQKVFFDGRSDFYGEDLGKEYLALLQGNHQALSIVRQRGFNVMLLPVEWPLADLLKREPGWRVVDNSKLAILFAAGRRNPEGANESKPTLVLMK